MAEARITAVHLTAFKSFVNEVLPLSDLTILTGLNSSGKSNALDGLDVLSRLATGGDLADVLDGRGQYGPGEVRGGSAGCPPHGTDTFELGCTVELGDEVFEYSVTVRVAPDLRIEREQLQGPARAEKSKKIRRRDLITATGEENAPGLDVRIHNGRRGVNPATFVRDNRSVLAQAPILVRTSSIAGREVLHGVDVVQSALQAVFEFDPVPIAMRDYVRRSDAALKRDGSNLSAAILNLQHTQPARAQKVVEAISTIAANQVTGVQFETTTRDEVMLSLTEHDGSRTSAREMSDGLLRFAAVATALQSTAQDLDVDADDDAVPLTPDSEPVTGKVRVVLEEIENGLHPSQARVALRMIEDAVTSSGLQVTVTTHSPALLNALTGELNDKVVVCYRDEEGHSRLSPLVELSGYAQAMAHGEIGDLVTRSELVAPTPERSVDLDAFLSAIGG